jgi:hypothetical protein
MLTATGCGGGVSAEFASALKKIKAVTSVGANKQEFRASLQSLAAASDGSNRADKIVSAYKASLELWDLIDSPQSAGSKIDNSSNPRMGGFTVPVKNGEYKPFEFSKDDQRAWYARMFEFMKANRDLVTVDGDEWQIGPDALPTMWAKASKL